MEWIPFIFGFALSFLIGGLPFSFWLVKIFKKVDLRKVGSQNVGATNVFRTQGKLMGSVALALDIFKGFAVIIFLYPLFESQPHWDPFLYHLTMGVCAILGHTWTPFLGFKGGKGVAASAGVFLGLLPVPFLFALGFFIVSFALTKIISVGSLTAACVFPLGVYLFEGDNPQFEKLLIISIFLAVFIFFTHRKNIKRIISGEEKKITDK